MKRAVLPVYECFFIVLGGVISYDRIPFCFYFICLNKALAMHR